MSADRWGDETAERAPRLAELRDAPPPPLLSGNRADRRAQRIADMQREVTKCTVFIEDCDQYGPALNNLQHGCIRTSVHKAMLAHLGVLRQTAESKRLQLQRDLATLTGQT